MSHRWIAFSILNERISIVAAAVIRRRLNYVCWQAILFIKQSSMVVHWLVGCSVYVVGHLEILGCAIVPDPRAGKEGFRIDNRQICDVLSGIHNLYVKFIIRMNGVDMK